MDNMKSGDFADAAEKARLTARATGRHAAVICFGGRWFAVGYRPEMHPSFGKTEAEEHDEEYFSPDTEDSREGLSSDQDDWARSEEEGWFYNDD